MNTRLILTDADLRAIELIHGPFYSLINKRPRCKYLTVQGKRCSGEVFFLRALRVIAGYCHFLIRMRNKCEHPAPGRLRGALSINSSSLDEQRISSSSGWRAMYRLPRYFSWLQVASLVNEGKKTNHRPGHDRLSGDRL